MSNFHFISHLSCKGQGMVQYYVSARNFTEPEIIEVLETGNLVPTKSVKIGDWK